MPPTDNTTPGLNPPESHADRAGTRSAEDQPLRPQAQSLLIFILAQICRYGDTPLRFEIDAQGIATRAWSYLLADRASGCGEAPNWADLARLLDDRVDEILATAVDEPAASMPSCGGRSAADLAGWVHQLQAAMRKADPQCPEIMRWLAEGYSARDVARRLGIGLRLMRRIVSEMRAPAPSEPDSP